MDRKLDKVQSNLEEELRDLEQEIEDKQDKGLLPFALLKRLEEVRKVLETVRSVYN